MSSLYSMFQNAADDLSTQKQQKKKELSIVLFFHTKKIQRSIPLLLHTSTKNIWFMPRYSRNKNISKLTTDIFQQWIQHIN